jgi:hypothetical protein
MYNNLKDMEQIQTNMATIVNNNILDNNIKMSELEQIKLKLENTKKCYNKDEDILIKTEAQRILKVAEKQIRMLLEKIYNKKF